MYTAFISMGSNLGDSVANLARARLFLEEGGRVSICHASSLYRTEPQGDSDQPWFYNQVLQLETELEADALLELFFSVENRLGRVRDAQRRFGPRPIDLDVLLFEDMVIQRPNLIVPHPRMHERAFVLIPLLEIAPEISIPKKGLAKECLARLEHTLEDDKIYQSQ